MKFYYFDDSDYIVMGPYSSAQEAKEEAQAAVPHTRAVTIVSHWAVSRPPSLKRRYA